MRKIWILGSVLAVEGLAFVTLMALRSAMSVPHPTEILSATAPQAINGTAWFVAFALATWVAASTIASVIVRLARIPSAIRVVDLCTHPAIRRMAERVTALSLVASGLVSPAIASASEAPPIPVVVVTDTTAAMQPGAPPDPAPHVAPSAAPDPFPPINADTLAPSISPVPQPTPAVSVTDEPPTRYIVRAGDNMWSITASYLEAQLGTRPSDARVSETWRIVMDLNRAGIRSGNVDLIFPGEELVLPPVAITP